MGDENWVTLREKTVGAAERRVAWDAELATVPAMARRAAGNTEDMMLSMEDLRDPSATTKGSEILGLGALRNLGASLSQLRSRLNLIGFESLFSVKTSNFWRVLVL